MTQEQIISAITTALQTADANGEFSNVVLVMQALIVQTLPNLSLTQLQQICTILNINTSGS